MSRPLVVPVIIWLGVIAAVLGAASWLSSCATKPLPACASYEYRLAEDSDGEEYRVLDAEDVAKLHALIMGLANNTCRLPPAPAPKPQERPEPRPMKGLHT